MKIEVNRKKRKTFDCLKRESKEGPNDLVVDCGGIPQDLGAKSERLWLSGRQRPEALKNLNFFEKKLKKGVDNRL